MKESLRQICSEFLRARDVLKDAMGWENAYVYPIAATVLVGHADVDAARIRECRTLLERETGMFHTFRGITRLVTVATVAADAHPEERLARALELFDLFKKRFWDSTYLPIAALMLSESVEPARYADLVSRTRAIYDRMKAEHPFLTSSEDSAFAAMLALSEERDADVICEIERCYTHLKSQFASANAVQSLSHVLALTKGDAEAKCSATMELFHALKAQGKRYGTAYELPTLGVLATLSDAREEIVKDLSDADDLLSSSRGYGGLFGFSARPRLMHAGMLVVLDRKEQGAEMRSAALGSMVSTVAAQQAAMLAAVAAATAANAANSN